MSAVLDDEVGFDEPAADERPRDIAAPTTDRNAVVISNDLTRVQNALNELDRVAASLPEIAKQFPPDVVYEITTTKGMEAAKAHRAAWRDPRITVEKARSMAKAPILALGKNIDARAARLKEQLLIGETPIDQLIKAEEARREEARQAKINAEMGRVMAIQEALSEIALDVQIACNKTSADIQALLDRMRTTEPDPLVFQEQIDQARAAWAAGIGKLETAHKAKLWDEEQEAQRAAAEAERKRQQEAEDAERARIAAEQAAEAKRLAAQQQAMKIQQVALLCIGKSAAVIRDQLVLMENTAYPEDTPAIVLEARAQTLPMLTAMLSAAEVSEEAARAAAAQVIEVPPVAPVADGSQDSNGEGNDIAPAKAGPHTPSESGEAPEAAEDAAPIEPQAATGSGSGFAYGGYAGPAAHAEERAAAPAWIGYDLAGGPDQSIETTEAEAREPSPELVGQIVGKAACGNTELLREALSLVEYLRGPFEGRFPSHPKPAEAWWQGLLPRLDSLQPRLEAACGVEVVS